MGRAALLAPPGPPRRAAHGPPPRRPAASEARRFAPGREAASRIDSRRSRVPPGLFSLPGRLAPVLATVVLLGGVAWSALLFRPVTVRGGDVVLTYDRSWISDYEAGRLLGAHRRALAGVERLTGLRHDGVVRVRARRERGRDVADMGGVDIHFRRLGRGHVAGYRPPAHEHPPAPPPRVSGRPSPLLREGVAVYVAWRLERRGTLREPPGDLVALEASDAFGIEPLARHVDGEYRRAGTLVRWLVERHGWERFFRAYSTGRDVRSVLSVGFGLDPDTVPAQVAAWAMAGPPVGAVPDGGAKRSDAGSPN